MSKLLIALMFGLSVNAANATNWVEIETTGTNDTRAFDTDSAVRVSPWLVRVWQKLNYAAPFVVLGNPDSYSRTVLMDINCVQHAAQTISMNYYTGRDATGYIVYRDDRIQLIGYAVPGSPGWQFLDAVCKLVK